MNEVASNWLPLGFHHWMPAAQALTLGLLTFVQEDVPAVGAAVLAAAGRLTWPSAFLGIFFGIWVGDALLYLLARGLGRPLLERPWARRFLDPAAVARSEAWFARRGIWLLLSSRFVPGTRLPTYLAAGFLRLPFSRFVLVTGCAVFAWTLGLFALASTVGPELLTALKRWNTGGWGLAAAVAVPVVLVRTLPKVVRVSALTRLRIWLVRWTRWEFWPAWLFYFPVVVNYVRLAIRYRGWTLPTAANPGIFSGGFVGESKMATLRDLHGTSPEFTAEAHLLPAAHDAELRLAQLENLLRDHHIEYPYVLKPDVGQRGVGVKLIREREQAVEYLRRTSAALVVQRYAPGPHEGGVFYYRFPGEPRGHIFAITEKIFPTLTGDGERTLEQLVWADERACFMGGKYLRRFSERRTEVLPAGATLKLVEAGNHAQGCIFRDGGRMATEALERHIDEISQRLDGFFIGRYDIRYASEDDLRAGRNFQIIELNGAASEATSIYDARNSVVAAYRTLFRQWELVFAIGSANRARGAAPTRLSTLWHAWRATNVLIATYPHAD